MSEQDTRPEMSEEDLFQQLRNSFEQAGGDDLSPEEERCLRSVAGEIKVKRYTRSQIERRIKDGWRPCEDVLSQGS